MVELTTPFDYHLEHFSTEKCAEERVQELLRMIEMDRSRELPFHTKWKTKM